MSGKGKKSAISAYVKEKGQAKKNKQSEARKVAIKDKRVTKNARVKQIISVPLPANVSQKNVVSSILVPAALQESFVGLLSYLISRGVTQSMTATSSAIPWAVVYDGMKYLMQSFGSEIQGTVILNKLPKVTRLLLGAMLPKDIGYHGQGIVSYAWNTFDPLTLQLAPFQIGQYQWNTTFVDPGLATTLYDSPAFLYGAIASSVAYSTLFKIMAKLGPAGSWLSTVKRDDKGLYDGDASAFARSYRYNGLTGASTGGMWRDLELEVGINAPDVACFVEYPTFDTRVPSKIQVFSGGPMLTQGNYLNPLGNKCFNKTPPVFKQIDVNEIIVTLALMAAAAKEKMQVFAQTNAGGDTTAIDPFPFTYQDFRIIVIQALKQVFDCQYSVQSMGYIQSDNTTNYFSPLFIMGNTYSTATFNQFKLPILMRENLAALRNRKVNGFAKTSKINEEAIYPVLGLYILDTQPVFTYVKNGVVTNLFDTTSQSVINIVNGTISPTRWVDLNCEYYLTQLENWNFFIENCSAVLETCSPIVGDSGAPGWTALVATRIESTGTGNEQTKELISQSHLQSLKYLENGPYRERKNSKGKVENIPPALILAINCDNITSASVLTSELQTFISNLWLPSVRLNPQEDALTINMYQIEAREPISNLYAVSNSITGTGLYSTLGDYARICVPGSARSDSSEYSEMLKHMCDAKKAGMLAGLLGGFAKQMFPQAGALIDTLADIVPL